MRVSLSIKEDFKCVKLEGFVKCSLEPKSKCKRKKLELELEGWGGVDVGKGVPNHYKSGV